MNLRVTISQPASRLQGILRMLGADKLTELHAAMGAEIQELTVRHISELAATRHATAERLGATPTNHFAQAADKVARSNALEADASGATLTINHKGFSRAFRDVQISPTTSRVLAIPIHPMAYGVRAAALWKRLGLFIPKGKRIIAATLGGVLTPMYVLCARVSQKQDRSLLPSDQEYQDAAAVGAKGWLGMALAKGGNL